ncbi:hypothetical protein [Thermogutta sp.]|nr:hypothetical protein [Thermogutta sp.]
MTKDPKPLTIEFTRRLDRQSANRLWGVPFARREATRGFGVNLGE